MAIGEHVSISELQHLHLERGLLRFRGKLPDGEAVDDYAEASLFEEADAPAAARSRRRARWLPPQLVAIGSSRAATPRRASILRLLQTWHDVQQFGTRFGIEDIGVPYPHQVLLGAFSGGIEDRIRQQIESQVRASIEAYVDELTPVRVLCRNSDALPPGELALYFGRGVFVPEPGAEPQGYVEISAAAPNGETTDRPMLGHAPAGFYRGQSALAFGTSQATVPATVQPNLLLPFDHGVYFFIEPDPDDPATLTLKRIGETLRPGGEPTGWAYDHPQSIPPTQDGETALRVDCEHRGTGQKRPFILRACRDGRPSRLHGEPLADEAYLEIAGFIAPRPSGSQTLRWWIELDRNNRLIGLAGIGRATSVLLEGRRLAYYEWNNLRFREGAAVAHRLERIDNGERFVLRAPGDAAFGYLSWPETATPVMFNGEWWKAPGSYALDWLDFSGCVEGAVQAGKPEGLATDAVRRYPGARMPGRRPSDGTTWLVRPPGPNASFSGLSRFDPLPGSEVIVGPLVLRVPR